MLRLKGDFGACCDGVTPDDAPMAAAMAAWSATGGDLVIEGTPLLTQPVAQSLGKPSRLVGGGEIRWNCTNPGLHLTMTTLDRFTAEGLSFSTSKLADGVGFKLTCPTIASGTHQGPVLRDLTFKGLDTSLHCWERACVVEKAWNAELEGISVKGQDDAYAPFVNDVGIELLDCMHIDLDDCDVFHCQDAIRTGGQRTEGLNITGGELVGVNRGIVIPLAIYLTAGTYIGNLHANAYERCIVGWGLAQIKLSEMLLYKVHVATGYWQGVEIVNSDSVRLSQTSFRGNPTATGGNDCISIGHSSRITVEDCDGGDFASVGSMALLYGTSSNCRIVSKAQERGVNCTGPVNWASGAGNVLDVT